ncbi:MAG: hypothetical protein WC455_19015 [Dehalococcoidia bacterium]|jgi:hypothetical protein
MLTDKPQFKQGMEVEAFLDTFFQYRGWQIVRTTSHEERVLCLGDRRFTKEDNTYLVEYKSGIQTAFTGNIFLETISVDTQNKPGWVYTCKADYIFYAALLNGKILIFVPSDLRARIEALKRSFKVVKTSHAQNDGYNTHGVIVPLAYAERNLAKSVIHIETRAA